MEGIRKVRECYAYNKEMRGFKDGRCPGEINYLKEVDFNKHRWVWMCRRCGKRQVTDRGFENEPKTCPGTLISNFTTK